MNNDINNFKITRRRALKLGLLTAGAVTIGEPFSAESAQVKEASAKSVIQIWMWGGPAHLDTFDPKPQAGSDYCGPLNKPINTNADGIRICEKLPLLAKQADKYSLIRSMTHGINAHETASYKVQTGHDSGRLVYPSAGAVVSLLKGYDNGYKSNIPPYIVLTQPQGRFSESGFLGIKYKPFSTGSDPNRKVFAVEGIIAEGIDDSHQLSRRALLSSIDTFGNVLGKNPLFTKFDVNEEKAYAMMFGHSRDVFNLAKEKDSLREKYGRNTFGQSCLAARRLVENGVPYVTINYKGWDTHKQHFQTMNRKLPEFDAGISALLQDLSDRGLLDSTIIWCGGEFGRSPKVQWNPPWNGGRSHYGKCFSTLIAGGGFKNSVVVGESDATGSEVKNRPVHPQELIASIYKQLGIDANSKLPNLAGVDTKIMPLEKGNKLLEEIM